AHIAAAIGWPRFVAKYGRTGLGQYLAEKPLAAVEGMIARGVNAPLASSCGRLFDAVAAAVGLCADRVQYEGQAAMQLQAAAERAGTAEDGAYPFAIARPAPGAALHLDPAPMWSALLDDIAAGTATERIAARLHAGLADAIARLVATLAPPGRIALSGGSFQNRRLLEQVMERLAARGFDVLTHRAVPANDGGLALGQAAVAAAHMLDADEGE
ncbi:MAG: hypothetical protein ACREF1_09245, partial [Acetobacteraceae bacterium]